jgi:4-alpha-glucanotransferase
LSRHGVFGCSVEWFEQDSGVFRKPSTWRENALASVNTHDLPPAAGYLNYEQVKIRQRLNLLTTSVEEFKADAVREHDGMIAMLVDNGFLDRELAQDEAAHEQEIVEAQYRALTSAPSKLLAAAVVDGVGERRAQNQPGTNNEYPNWRVPLADGNGDVVPLEELFDNPRMQSLADVMNG